MWTVFNLFRLISTFITISVYVGVQLRAILVTMYKPMYMYAICKYVGYMYMYDIGICICFLYM